MDKDVLVVAKILHFFEALPPKDSSSMVLIGDNLDMYM